MHHAEAQVQATHHMEISSGPLPPPHFFEAYEQTLPGAADRILRMAEGEQRHRHRQQSGQLDSDIALETRGQWMACVVAMSGIIGGHDARSV